MPERFVMSGPLNDPLIVKFTWCNSILQPCNITAVNGTRHPKWHLYKVAFFSKQLQSVGQFCGKTPVCFAECLGSSPLSRQRFFYYIFICTYLDILPPLPPLPPTMPPLPPTTMPECLRNKLFNTIALKCGHGSQKLNAQFLCSTGHTEVVEPPP